MEAPDWDWIHLDETDSTNRWGAEWLRGPGGKAGRPAVILAATQTAGRGQFGRAWVAVPGRDLAMTFAHPAPKLREGLTPAHWSMVWAGAVREALAPFTSARLRIKWPNDLLAELPDGTWAKLGGILVENHWQGGRLAGVLIGVGLNLAARPPGEAFRAVGLETLRGSAAGLSPQEVGAAVGRGLAYTFHRMPPREDLLTDYLRHLHGLGQPGTYTRNGAPQRGILLGFTPEGDAQFDWLDTDS